MSKEKILSFAVQALDVTKMVLIISANTAIKLASEGKKEIIKQYGEYQKHRITAKALSGNSKIKPLHSGDGDNSEKK